MEIAILAPLICSVMTVDSIDKCDLAVYPADQYVSEYPAETRDGFSDEMSFTVRNIGGYPSGTFDLQVEISDGEHVTIEALSCASLQPGEETSVDYTWSASWFDPPSSITVDVHADPAGQCDDSWPGNNQASLDVQLNDIYPFEDGWPVAAVGVVGTTPMLVDIDTDPELEVVAVAGSRLSAWDHTGSRLWRCRDVAVASNVQPLAADFDGDLEMETAVIDVENGAICMIDGDGTLLGSTSTSGLARLSAADMTQDPGLEIVGAAGGTIYLFQWDSGNFTLLDSKIFTYPEEPTPQSLTCSDLSGDGYAETVFYSAKEPQEFPQEGFYSIAVYDWENQSVLSDQTWETAENEMYPVSTPCAGELAGSPLVGFPQRQYAASGDNYPAWLLPPDGSAIEYCERSGVSANSLRFGMFADWRELIPGADAFVLPCETQCFGWDDGGDPLQGWPVTFVDYDLSSPVSPPALGNLDNVGFSDVLTGTVLDGDWQVLAFDAGGLPLDDIGFPFILPDFVTGLGGFAVADIDRDGWIEIVFGSSDGLLQCWQLGECSTGYAPWPQYQHDCGRSGVLE